MAVYTVNSRLLEPPREIEKGSSYRELTKFNNREVEWKLNSISKLLIRTERNVKQNKAKQQEKTRYCKLELDWRVLLMQKRAKYAKSASLKM